jgi:hypothetical protein
MAASISATRLGEVYRAGGAHAVNRLRNLTLMSNARC